MSYATSLTTALRTAVSAKIAPIKATGKGGKSKKRSKTQSMDEAVPVSAPTPVSQAKQSNWGLLDPLRSLLGPASRYHRDALLRTNHHPYSWHAANLLLVLPLRRRTCCRTTAPVRSPSSSRPRRNLATRRIRAMEVARRTCGARPSALFRCQQQ